MACESEQAAVDAAESDLAAAAAALAQASVTKDAANANYDAKFADYLLKQNNVITAQSALLVCLNGGDPAGRPKKMQPVKPDPDDELAQARETARQLADAISRMEAARREQPAA